MRTVVAITSRWRSTRLQGKALLKIKGKCLIDHIVERAKKANVDEVVVATTLESPSIVTHCQRYGIPYFAYPNDWNVLGRLVSVADAYNADILIYLWGDCPFINPIKINKGLEYFKISHDYFFDMSQPMAIMDASLLRELSTQKLSKHKLEYIHEYMLKLVRPVIEINTREDLEKANGMV